jgi:citrate synthase
VSRAYRFCIEGGIVSGTTTPTPRGLDGVVAAQTRLSHVDGLAGELVIGGYELKELAGRVGFEEAAHLLWRGGLPGREELAALRREIAARRELPAATLQAVRDGASAPPIDALRMACSTLSLDVPDPNDISPAADLHDATMLAARFPTIVAAHARLSQGKEPIPPRPDLSLAANFLYMVHGREPDPIAARALDTY